MVSADPLETLRDSLSDRYRVERLLGSGGMATVYLAQDLKHDRPVAIKVLRPMLAAALGPERFLREIQIAAKLNHPHILALHDSGEAEGLLYYVMPYVEGESLQGRLAREKQLPVGDAVRIAGEVASALAYAHGHGVIHRDIKPGNILLSNGYALVADFGLARAISSARAKSDVSITHSAMTIGTPTYMSPEQSSGEAEIDGRSDIYALGCVLYELLVGDPPFIASSPSALMARHASAKAVPIRALRPLVPAGIESAVMRSLEKMPADRYQKAEELGEALRAGSESVVTGGLPRWVAQGALLTIAAALLVLLVRTTGGGDDHPAIDTARYAVLEPVGLAAGDAAARELAQLLQAALGRWKGVNVVDRFQVGDITAREDGRPIDREGAGRLARDLGAGRYVRSEAVRSGDSLQLRIGFFEVGRPTALGEEATVLRGDLVGADTVIAANVDRLLLRGLGSGGPEAGVRSTTSLPALQAYARGQTAIQNWKLAEADSAFEESLRYDSEFTSAMLWLAQVRNWNSLAAVRWHPLAEQALAARARLGAGEALLAEAIAAQARGDYPSACAIYRRETGRDPRRFVAWYGLAKCVAADNLVIADRKSPSGWRFRSSYEEAVKAYLEALAILPSMHAAFRGDGFQRIQEILYTSSNGVRSGLAAPPDSGLFLAYPSWRGDSLAFIPYRQAEFSGGNPAAREGKQEALLRQRRRFHDLAVAWRGFFPNGADALEALALSLELLGDPSALDTLLLARRAAKVPGDNSRVAASEIWLRLKLALPDDIRGLQAVRILADSLLDRANDPDAPDPAQLARIAVLRGRGFLAVDLGAKAAAQARSPIPRALARDGPAFWTFAALGGPRDSLERLEGVVASAIETLVLPAEQGESRRDWLSRPSSLAYPDVRLASFERLPTGKESLAYAQTAASRQDWGEVRRVLGAIRSRRRDVPPEDVTFDRLFPEAHLLTLLGDAQGAADWLDPTLAALRRLAPQSLVDVPNVGGLLRGIAFRAELAARLGDTPTARRWAGAITILWDRADPFLEPVVRRMKDLAR